LKLKSSWWQAGKLTNMSSIAGSGFMSVSNGRLITVIFLAWKQQGTRVELEPKLSTRFLTSVNSYWRIYVIKKLAMVQH